MNSNSQRPLDGPVDRLTTIVPILPLVAAFPINIPEPNPRSQLPTHAPEEAGQNIDCSKLAAILQQTDCSHVKLRSGQPPALTASKNATVQKILSVAENAFSAAPTKPRKSSQKPAKKRQSAKARPETVSFQQASSLQLHPRERLLSGVRPVVDAQIATAALHGSAPATTSQQNHLHEVFCQTVASVKLLHEQLACDGRAADACLRNEEVATLLKAFKKVHAALDGCSADVLVTAVPLDVMRSFLLTCQQQARAGTGARLHSLHEEMTSRASMLMQAGFEAVCVLLAIVSSQACTPELFREDMLSTICCFLTKQVQGNLTAFFDSQTRTQFRADLQGELAATSSQERKGVFQASGKYLIAAVNESMNRLETLAQHMCLASEGLGTLLRALVRALGAPALMDTHVNISVFLCTLSTPKRRESEGAAALDGLLEQVTAQALALHDTRACHLLADQTYVRTCTLFTLLSIQRQAELPSGEAARTPGFWNPTLQLASVFWSTLLGQMMSSVDHTPREVKLFIEGLVAEIAALLTLPQWPAAQLLLYVLATRLQGLLDRSAAMRSGRERTEVHKDVPELSLELAGFLVAKIMGFCIPKNVDYTLLVRLLAMLDRAPAGGRHLPESSTEISMEVLREHEDLLMLLVCGWLRLDAQLDAKTAQSSVTFSIAQALVGKLQRLRASEMEEPGNNSSSSVSRPEDGPAAAVDTCSRLLLLDTADEAARGLLESVVLSAQQAKSLMALITYSGMLGTSVDLVLGSIARACLVANEPAVKIRVHAWRALAAVVAVDPRVLTMSLGNNALMSALSQKESSAQVQDKALDLLSQHIKGDAQMCRSCLPFVRNALRHHATSVRKRAVDMLWECYVNNAVFAGPEDRSLVLRLLLLQLQMYEDREKGIKGRIFDAFHARWFSAPNAEGARAAARELVSIMRLLAVDGAALVPMPPDFVLQQLLQSVLVPEEAATGRAGAAASKSAAAATRKTVSLMTHALLEAILGDSACTHAAVDGSESDEIQPDMAAVLLLAFVTVDAALLVPQSSNGDAARGPQDPFKYLQGFTIFLRDAAGALASLQGGGGSAVARRLTEMQFNAVLEMVAALLRETSNQGFTPPDQMVQDLCQEVDALIRSGDTAEAIVRASCECLAELAVLSEEIWEAVAGFCQGLYGRVADLLQIGSKAEVPKETAGRFKRMALRLAYLLRHISKHPSCMDVLVPGSSAAAASNATTRAPMPLPTALIELLASTHTLPPEIQDTALIALGQVLIGYPEVVNEKCSQIVPLLHKGLSQASSVATIKNIIRSISELVRVEDQGFRATEGNATKAQDSKQGPLARANGTDEGVSNAATIIQSLWGEASCEAGAVSASGICSALLFSGDGVAEMERLPNSESAKLAAEVRDVGIVLVSLVQAGGSLAPWLYFPTTVALSMDLSSSISEKAVKILKRAAAKVVEVELMASALSTGIQLAMHLHMQILARQCEPAAEGDQQLHWQRICATFADGLFHQVIKEHKKLQSKLHEIVAAACDAATNPSVGDDGVTLDRLRTLCFVAQLLAATSLQTRDAVLHMLFKLNRVIGRRASVVDEAQELRRGEEHVAAAEQQASGRGCRAERMCMAAVGLCVVLSLKHYLVHAYGLKEAAVADFNPDAKSSSSSMPAERDSKVKLHLKFTPQLDQATINSATTLAALQTLLDSDTHDSGAAARVEHRSRARPRKKQSLAEPSAEGTPSAGTQKKRRRSKLEP